MELLSVKNLSFKYPTASTNALNNVSLTVNDGDFVLLCGESGCGKTTLLRQLKKEITPTGTVSGTVFYNGKPVKDMSLYTSATAIGYVRQNPQAGIVTDKVWHELAFALENIGETSTNIRKRVGEMATFFGISSWYNKSTANLSGGQMQILNLAAAMVLNPKVLILDEPTSQLDPIAATDFLNLLIRINEELGTTIIITEHRLEEVFRVATGVAVMENGEIICYDSPTAVGSFLNKNRKNSSMLLGMPSAMRIFSKLSVEDICPVTVKQGKQFLSKHFNPNKNTVPNHNSEHTQPLLQLKDVWFRYEKKDKDILCGLNLTVNMGEHYAILGSNGSGKTTALNVMAKTIRPYMGKMKLNLDKEQAFSLLPQDPTAVFIKDTVKEDYIHLLKLLKYSHTEAEAKISNVANLMGIKDLLDKHPFDISGGEQQKCAIGKLLLNNPKLLFLDEPTKGLDPQAKSSLGLVIKNLQNKGITVVTVTHDTDFAAEFADKCGLMFNGEIIAEDEPPKFFGGNNFYTTNANRISRHLYTNAVTCTQVVELCKRNEKL